MDPYLLHLPGSTLVWDKVEHISDVTDLQDYWLHLAQIWEWSNYWCNLGYGRWHSANRSRKGKIKDDSPNALVYLANLFFLLSSRKCPIKFDSRTHWCSNQFWLFVIRASRSFLSAYYLSAYLCQGICYHELGWPLVQIQLPFMFVYPATIYPSRRNPFAGIEDLIGFSWRTNSQNGLLCGFPFGNRKDFRTNRASRVEVLTCCSLLCMWAIMHHSLSALSQIFDASKNMIPCMEYSLLLFCDLQLAFDKGRGAPYVYTSISRKQEIRISYLQLCSCGTLGIDQLGLCKEGRDILEKIVMQWRYCAICTNEVCISSITQALALKTQR